MKRALIIGAAGQDGTLLRERLRVLGVLFLGVGRAGAADRPGSLGDPDYVRALVREFAPSHLFYLAAHHHSSQDAALSDPQAVWRESLAVQVSGLVHCLEALRLHAPDARLFYAGSSHLFGAPEQSPQTERTPFAPANIYGLTKLAGVEACRYYRRAHGLRASVGILYNHESALRPAKFLSRKVIEGALAIKQGRQDHLLLGDLSAEVDWGYAPDFVEAMCRIAGLDQADDFIVATNQAHAVRAFVARVFETLGLDYREYVREDPSLLRKKSSRLVGDYGKLEAATGWRPSLSFSELIPRLVAETQKQLEPMKDEGALA